LIAINVLFWLGLISSDSMEYHDNAYHYQQMDYFKKIGLYEKYLDASGKEKYDIKKANPIPEGTITAYTRGEVIGESVRFFAPFMLLIYLNWLYLIPRFLVGRNYWKYIWGLLALVVVIAFYLSFQDYFSGDTYLKVGEDSRAIFQFTPFMEGVGACSMALFISSPIYFTYNWFTQQNQINRLENERLSTELNLLKSQINPHFFFNTLNNLYSLTLENSNLASNVILKLSDLMRYTIYDGKEEKVAIHQEVECLENYLSLQSIRTHRKVDVRFEKDIHNPKLEVPPLLFLGFIENAFKHGVDSFRDGAFVEIKLKTTPQELLFSVNNNYDKEERPEGGGNGLENVKRRLALLYPDGQHELDILDHDPTFGVSLKIIL